MISKHQSEEMDKWAWSNLRGDHPSEYKSTHAMKLERWLGRDVVDEISMRFKHWQGPPVAIANVPGYVYAMGGGDFCGAIQGGYFGNLMDYTQGWLKRVFINTAKRGMDPLRLNAGFTSLSDLISEATTGGKKQVLPFQKVGIAAPAVGSAQDLWRVGSLPSAGATAATADTGTIPTNATAGTLGQTDAASGDQLHFTGGWMVSTQAQGSSLLLCDKLFAVNRNYNSNVNQAITGVPTRYQTTATAPGNFQFTNVTTNLGATPANVTLTYMDQAGNTAEAGPAQVVRISSTVDTNPLTAPLWFYFLNAGDTGLRKLTNFILSAAMGAGNADRGIYHAIGLFPGIGAANTPMVVDGINSSFNLERVYDGAALDFIEFGKSATTAATYTGHVVLASG